MPTSLDDYEVVDVIGTGSYGVCKKIRRKKDGRILVWKELNYGSMSEMEKQMLVSEVNLLRELKHKHIVRYYDRIIDRPNTTLYIVMEYCEGGDLNTLLNNKKKDQQNFDEFFIWKICSQIILALKECHSRERNGKAVLHRDLKPANVFLDRNNNVKLGDFGLARVLNHDTSFAKTFVGTPYYMSPEQINYMSYNAKSDIWSLGCLLYELCAHRPPFTAMNQRELASKISVGRFMRIPNRYSDELNSFIGTLIQVDEHKRPTIERLLEHPTVRLYAPGATSATSSPGSDTAPPPPRRRPSMEAAGSGDEGYSSRKLESIKRREDELLELEKRLKQKEADLEVREKNVSLREKLAEDRLLRADRLVREYKTVKSTCSCGASIRVKASDSSPHGTTSNPAQQQAESAIVNTPTTSHWKRVLTPHKLLTRHSAIGAGKENCKEFSPHPPNSAPPQHGKTGTSPGFPNRRIKNPSSENADVKRRHSSGHQAGRKVLGVLNSPLLCGMDYRDRKRAGVIE